MNTYYTPTYIMMDGKDVYFDMLIVRQGQHIWTYAAYGDGAHVNQVAVAGPAMEDLHADDKAYHIDELKNAIDGADALIFVNDHKVVYKRDA